jgi:hypothetical protein
LRIAASICSTVDIAKGSVLECLYLNKKLKLQGISADRCQ